MNTFFLPIKIVPKAQQFPIPAQSYPHSASVPLQFLDLHKVSSLSQRDMKATHQYVISHAWEERERDTATIEERRNKMPTFSSTVVLWCTLFWQAPQSTILCCCHVGCAVQLRWSNRQTAWISDHKHFTRACDHGNRHIKHKQITTIELNFPDSRK